LTLLVTRTVGPQSSTSSFSPAAPGEVGIMMTLSGVRVLQASRVLADVDGVSRIDQLHDDSE
jgi:putative Mg2+ transporter-C (MgtC) family protein